MMTNFSTNIKNLERILTGDEETDDKTPDSIKEVKRDIHEKILKFINRKTEKTYSRYHKDEDAEEIATYLEEAIGLAPYGGKEKVASRLMKSFNKGAPGKQGRGMGPLKKAYHGMTRIKESVIEEEIMALISLMDPYEAVYFMIGVHNHTSWASLNEEGIPKRVSESQRFFDGVYDPLPAIITYLIEKGKESTETLQRNSPKKMSIKDEEAHKRSSENIKEKWNGLVEKYRGLMRPEQLSFSF